VNLTRKHAARVAVLAALLAAGAAFVPVYAQQDQPAPKRNNFGPRVQPQDQQLQPGGQPNNLPAPEIISTHGDWKLQCEKQIQKDQTAAAKKQCGMIQTVQSEKNPKIGLSLVLVKSKQADKDVTMMRVLAPIGVFLPTGVALEIDGAAVGRVPFTTCLPQVCMAFAEAQAETLDKMKKGSTANFIIYQGPGQGIPMKISLSGFSAALDELGKL
jgi:invasion protein IalB